jgi:acetyl/propionyl-CoA carboxylase alpha subunit
MPREFHYQLGSTVHTVTVESAGDLHTVRIGDTVFTVSARAGANGRLDLELDGRRLRAYVARSGRRRYVALGGQTWLLDGPDPRRAARGEGAGAGGSLTATMPGRVLDVLVSQGDAVAKGDTLVLLEAMKMELRITAPADGRVTAIHCHPGQVVERSQLLVEVSQS